MPHRAGYLRSRRIAVISLLVNLALAFVKLVTGLVGHSYALVADAIESLADVFASVIVWSGLRIAGRPPDTNHPYGHGKAEPLAALLVALMLFGAGVGIGFQAVREIITPQYTPAPYTLWVLIAVVIVKEGMFRVARRVGRGAGSSAVLADAWHHRSDALTSLAAGVGIAIALIGGEGYEPADDWAALLASGVVLVNAGRLLAVPMRELMDTDQEEVTAEVCRIAGTLPGVAHIEKAFTRKSGLGYLVDMHMQVDPGMSVAAAHALSHDAKDAIRAALPRVQDVLIHIEPYEPAAAAPAAGR